MGWWSDLRESVGNAANSVANAVSDAAQAITETVTEVIEDPIGSLQSAGETALRSTALATQGLQNAVVSTIGSVADLGGMVLYDWTVRPAVNGIAGAMGHEGPFGERPNFTDAMIENTQWIEPQNDTERAILYGTQAIGEIGSFIALTAVTGGTYAAVRAGAGVARTASFVAGATRTAGALTNMSRTAVLIEGTMATVTFASEMYGSQKEEQLRNMLKTQFGISNEDVAAMSRSEVFETFDTRVEEQLAQADQQITHELTSVFGVAASEIEELSLVEKNARLTIEVDRANELYADHLIERGLNTQEVLAMSLEEKMQASLDLALDVAPREAMYAENDIVSDVNTGLHFQAAVENTTPTPEFQDAQTMAYFRRLAEEQYGERQSAETTYQNNNRLIA